MAKRKSKFVIRIADAGDSKLLKPNKLRAKDLADVILKFDNALSSLVKSQFGDDLGGMSILKITNGSINLECSAALPYEAAFGVLGQSIEDETTPAYARHVRKIIDELERFNLAHNSKIELKKDKKSAPIATIRKAIPVAIPQESEVAGQTVVYGKVVGISGTERIRVSLKLISGDAIEFYVPQELVKEFGRRYNEIIGVRGAAVWDISSNKMTSFELSDVLGYNYESPKTVFSDMKKEFAGIFDEVEDVDMFVRGQRED